MLFPIIQCRAKDNQIKLNFARFRIFAQSFFAGLFILALNYSGKQKSFRNAISLRETQTEKHINESL